ncbi:hypothetical protein TVAG_121900 [Trichomonas vaginalis G3]|uniref:Uncharacterized protein n=1 Tax=Trichomonas vaginalis (strain ATCC PRA-98 / G3) TaxID=412133 RepID=A2E9A1_TRIV3|nr:hypothetical protein TVAGG3_0421290 [Trichomonas vaginalis G3]EAY10786.1 hypothetical protein TVAG_121900 [Trichomonas vaginalis G3]KAI5536074.1 hypothetical protein TVAGG3_0421290 [Trichomonas vaginalis G3]|eukprot:XP_001323009.1 hypothetical protein [Trichomonas vaginalis G3]
MKKSDFDPSAPLPDFLLDQFVKETAKKETKEEEVKLPPNVVVTDVKAIKKERQNKAQEELQKMLNRERIKRTSYGTVLSDRSKAKVPSASFSDVKE